MLYDQILEDGIGTPRGPGGFTDGPRPTFEPQRVPGCARCAAPCVTETGAYGWIASDGEACSGYTTLQEAIDAAQTDLPLTGDEGSELTIFKVVGTAKLQLQPTFTPA